jgi:nucleoside 2-deoxyribosyltransferase
MKVYLAGPDVFFPDGAQIAARKKEICRYHGLVGLFPLDNEIKANRSNGSTLFREIFYGNTKMMDQADAIIANLTPFRGPSADVGTVYELGYMIARGKCCLGYTNVNTTYKERVAESPGLQRTAETNRPRDVNDQFVEDFGLADNLMIVEALASRGQPLALPETTPTDRWQDLTTFEVCVRRLRQLDRQQTGTMSFRAG